MTILTLIHKTVLILALLEILIINKYAQLALKFTTLLSKQSFIE